MTFIYLPNLRTAVTLPWKLSQDHNYNFQSYQPKLHIIVTQQDPFYLHNQSAFKFN